MEKEKMYDYGRIRVWVVKLYSEDSIVGDDEYSDLVKIDVQGTHVFVDVGNYPDFAIWCLKNANKLGINIPDELKSMMRLPLYNKMGIGVGIAVQWLEIDDKEWLCLIIHDTYKHRGGMRHPSNDEIKEAIEKGRLVDFSINRDRIIALAIYNRLETIVGEMHSLIRTAVSKAIFEVVSKVHNDIDKHLENLIKNVGIRLGN